MGGERSDDMRMKSKKRKKNSNGVKKKRGKRDGSGNLKHVGAENKGEQKSQEIRLK